MPDLNWNARFWDADYGWVGSGEEWSEPWGSSEAQWFGSLLPRIHRFLPCRRILEIAPGFGRWTRFLIPACEGFVGLELSAKCVAACQQTFARASYASFYQNDGLNLKIAGPDKFDFIFSFDSLVHADADVFAHYIPQAISLLTDKGVAFIHHSNYADSGAKENRGARSENVTANLVTRLVHEAGGHVIVQEVINWIGAEPTDCLTLFKGTPERSQTVVLKNLNFMHEAAIIKHLHNVYCKQVDSLAGRGVS